MFGAFFFPSGSANCFWAIYGSASAGRVRRRTHYDRRECGGWRRRPAFNSSAEVCAHAHTHANNTLTNTHTHKSL